MNSVLNSVPLLGTVVEGQRTGSAGGGGVGGTLESIASTVLKSGFGVLPLIGGLLGLFGGGGSDAPPPLEKYALPPSLAFDAAETGPGIADVRYDQNGAPRVDTSGVQERGSASPAAPQITVNVQAMDARSFLDRSSELAAAVREAMLNLNSINDVVNDL